MYVYIPGCIYAYIFNIHYPNLKHSISCHNCWSALSLSVLLQSLKLDLSLYGFLGNGNHIITFALFEMACFLINLRKTVEHKYFFSELTYLYALLLLGSDKEHIIGNLLF